MKNDYETLQNQIYRIISLTDKIINYSQSIFEDKNNPIIDRAYFSQIFNLFHFYWGGLFDTVETIEELLKRDENERIKYLLTNLPDGANNGKK